MHSDTIHVFINRKKFELHDPIQTGKALKELAGIPLTDVLFLQQPHEDLVIANDAKVTLKDGDHLHSQPPADYGLGPVPAIDPPSLGVDRRAELVPQPGDWTFVVIHGFPMPPPYQPQVARLLIKLPPLFPEAQPDMFWVHPPIRLPSGAMPRGTSLESVLGETWLGFSWHLAAGAWKPGQSELRDFMRCVRARLERQD